MQEADFEKLGQFYLGGKYDLAAGCVVADDEMLYDSKDLTTHALCVGMTGSGKTGLCIALLEEAALDHIPALIIDPKGDLGNLLLTFPDLAPADFQPWLDPADAVRKGLSVDELAKKTAQQWRDGLAQWGETPERIRRLREAAEVVIYTPGSNTGVPLSVLRSFTAPDKAILDNAELLRERVQAAVSGLLALVGVEGDPLRSREHILLANILDRSWRAGRDVDLGDLIHSIQKPPFDKVGFLDVDSFFAAKERFELSMAINNLMASPGFSVWTEGDPLEIDKLLYTPAGKPRLALWSIAHLSDAERMFFVTVLLNEVISWMRGQSGTSSLRAILYMDEVFGYFPPSANPPSKTPMLTLLKQARAFGLGVVLATQNPVDLDYKGLSNCGTWFLGRLQTERDKLRVLDGLEGASSAAGAQFDRAKMETILSGLGNRVFLMNNVHDDAPIVFQTRWALSFLRGPLNREQISTLMAERRRRPGVSSQSAASEGADSASAVATSGGKPLAPDAATARPVLPPEVPEKFLSPKLNIADPAKLVYRPALQGTGRVHFMSSKDGIDVWRDVRLLALAGDELSAAPWDEAVEQADEIAWGDPMPGARFGALPKELTQPKKYAALATALKDSLYRLQTWKLMKCAALKMTQEVAETPAAFQGRIALAAREQRDLAVEKLRAKFAPKLQALADQKRRAEQKLDKEKGDVKDGSVQSILSIGGTILGAVLGRKLGSVSNVNRAASSMKKAGRVAKERQDVDAAEENLAVIAQKQAELEAQFAAETAELRSRYESNSLACEEMTLSPKKTDTTVAPVTLVWTPWVVDSAGLATKAW
ncbi:MAG: ATP-binding protein [Planctomycetaceae bacterium]|nr:ATP-binding protein [Planctomycetaceae bacterium]